MNQEKIGKFIALLRKKKNLTQNQLAEILGVSDRTISKWETGRGMPELSLLIPLSEQLGISINELMTGEELNKEEYQNKFEANVVKVVSKVSKTNKIADRFLITFSGIFVALALWFCGYLFYTSFEFDEPFDEKVMNVYPSNDGIVYTNSSCGFSKKYLILNYTKNNETQGLIFINSKCTIESYYNYEKNNGDRTDLTVFSGTKLTIDLTNSNIAKNFKVYYTTIDFSKIRNANDKELEKIIEKSYLLYKSI